VDLLVRAAVHEHVVVAVVVKELHLLLLDDRLLDALVCPEGLVELAAGAGVAQRGAHEGGPLPGLDVLEVDDVEKPFGEVEGHAPLEVVGGGGSHRLGSWARSGISTAGGPWAPASGCGSPRG
jgi:hypothetical protein